MIYFFPRLYRTAGYGCDEMRFVKIDTRQNLMVARFHGEGCGYKWQRVKKLWRFIWVIKGDSFFDNECMFQPTNPRRRIRRFFWSIWLFITLRRVCEECSGTTLVTISRAHQPHHERSCGLCSERGWMVHSKHYILFWWIYNKLPFRRNHGKEKS